MPCSICPSFSLRCASLVQLQYLLVKIFLYLVFLEYCTLALQSGISEECLLLLSSLFNFGPGFKNSKLLLFFFLFFFLPLLFPFHYQGTAREREGDRDSPLFWTLSWTKDSCFRKAMLLSQRPSFASVMPRCLASLHERKPPTISSPSSSKKTGNDAWMCNEISEMCTDFLEICQLSNKK